MMSLFSVFGLTATIESCTGWKLNGLPEVRRFLKEPGHADSYGDYVNIDWKPGFAPVLYFKDDNGNVLEKVDLAPFTTDQIHALLADRGFERSFHEEVMEEDESFNEEM